MLNPKLDIMLGVAAFPSMHVAFQTFVALWVRRFSPRVSLFFFLLLTATFLGSIVTGWHYLIDSLARAGLGRIVLPGSGLGFPAAVSTRAGPLLRTSRPDSRKAAAVCRTPSDYFTVAVTSSRPAGDLSFACSSIVSFSWPGFARPPSTVTVNEALP